MSFEIAQGVLKNEQSFQQLSKYYYQEGLIKNKNQPSRISRMILYLLKDVCTSREGSKSDRI